MNNHKKYTFDEKIKGAESSAGCIFLIFTICSIIGLGLYIANPEFHKVVFSLSVLWLSNAILHILTHNRLRAKNPYKFRHAKWELNGKLYYYLGVKIYRKVLFFSPFALMSLGIRVFSGREDFERVLREIYVAEKSHINSLIFSGIIAISLYIINWKTESLILITGILFFHIYPIMLQRWNRGRMIRIVDKMNKNVC